jgi:hypothetical protein
MEHLVNWCLLGKFTTQRQKLFIYSHWHICFLHIFGASVWMKEKTSIRKALVELWRAKDPHCNIRSQLKSLKYPLRSFLALANDNVFSPECLCWWNRERWGGPGESSGPGCRVTPASVLLREEGHSQLWPFNYFFYFPHLCIWPVRFISVGCMLPDFNWSFSAF